MEVRVLPRDALRAVLPDVARLRIEVFREWPYLYDGDLAYEETYLRPYLDTDAAIIVGAFEGDRLVGAATGTPLVDHAEDFGAAFEHSRVQMQDIFYCAESVLLPEFRGFGVWHRFFDLREAHARDLGFTYCAFCGVLRPDDHPLRPDSPRLMDSFWRGRGYRPLKGVIATYKWKDLGADRETSKPLQFWMRAL